VPRLTLLFFGGAKDVPEAAKTVTARDSLPDSICIPNGRRWPRFSSRAATPEEVQHQ
jgi:hypothetical protein